MTKKTKHTSEQSSAKGKKRGPRRRDLLIEKFAVREHMDIEGLVADTPDMPTTRFWFANSLRNYETEIRGFTIKPGDVEIICRYSPRRIAQLLTFNFDEFLAATSSEIEEFARLSGMEYVEASRFLAGRYRADMHACIEYAMSIFEKKFGWLLYHAFSQWGFEAAAMTMHALEDKLQTQYERRLSIAEDARLNALEFQKMRMDLPRQGRPLDRPISRANRKSQFQNQVIKAMLQILTSQEEVTQPRVAKILHIGNPRNPKDRTLYNLLKRYDLDWKSLKQRAENIFKRTKNSPEKTMRKSRGIQ